VSVWIIAYAVSGVLAIVGAERGWRRLEVVLKPLTTLILLGLVGVPETRFSWLVSAGIVLSVVGDLALIWDSNRAFLVGLGAFLLAHVAYVMAFLGVAAFSPIVVVVALVVAVATTAMLRAIWAGAAGMHGPTIAYGVVISAMVVSATATVGGPLRWGGAAAIGAALFYASDASLALNRFRRPFPHAAIATMGIYWIGQIGIALAARLGVR
jgi:alkenylglycerophosphocholine hydrolase